MIAAAIVTNPVTIFFIVLVIILLAPVILTKLKIPHIIGMIAAGVLVGPYGFDILARDSSFRIFGQVGLLYLMFLAGLEIDMYRLRMNLKRGLTFGILTFMIPMAMGILLSIYLLDLSWITSILLGSVLASHTLIAYPVAARFGITKSPAVLIAVVGTIIAVIGSLLVLAAAVNMHQMGEFSFLSMGWLLLKLVCYCLGVLYLFPRLTRYFFKHYSDYVTQFVYILAMVFCSAWIAGYIGLEEVLGAFFAGLVLNRYVPSGSSLMGRIEFVGNALFIPYFLIGVGMMINLSVVSQGDTLTVTMYILGVALASKWLAAWLTQLVYHMNHTSRQILFGLSTAHTAVALAVVTIGYQMLNPDGSHMMPESILNATILVILVTCAIAPIVTTGAAAKEKIRMMESDDQQIPEGSSSTTNNILIPIANPVTSQPLVELALLMNEGIPNSTLNALHVRNDNSATSKSIGKQSLSIARSTAAAMDTEITTIERYDLNIVTGVVNVMAERDIDTVILGMHRKATVMDSFFGAKLEQLLNLTNKMVLISRCYIPVNTITRIVVYIPDKAQFETGFRRWVTLLASLTRQLGCRIIFVCRKDQRPPIYTIIRQGEFAIRAEFEIVEQYDDFILLSNKILDDDLFVVVSARINSLSYSTHTAEMPGFLHRYFSRNNLMVIYPEQFGEETQIQSFSDPHAFDLTSAPSPLRVKLAHWFDRLNTAKKRMITQRNRKPRI
ncbi:MAG: cation:proton antiporter [Muribaculaceae bacterium]|nr:cation:proton antiporter [Muribaculaceae bacterium]